MRYLYILNFNSFISSLARHKVIFLAYVAQLALCCAVISNACMMIKERAGIISTPSGLVNSGMEYVHAVHPKNETLTQSDLNISLAMVRDYARLNSVAAVDSLPYNEVVNQVSASVYPDTNRSGVDVDLFSGTPGYLDVMKPVLLFGRMLSNSDYSQQVGLSHCHVAVITASLSYFLYKTRDSVGKIIYVGGQPLVIVGVMRDVINPSPTWSSRSNFVIAVPKIPETSEVTYIYRLHGPITAATKNIFIRKMNSIGLVVDGLGEFSEIKNKYLESNVFVTRMLKASVIFFLVVTLVGITSMSRLLIDLRKRSIGIRRSLGACQSDIMMELLFDFISLGIIGCFSGFVGAVFVHLYLVRYIYEGQVSIAACILSSVAVFAASLLSVTYFCFKNSSVSPVAVMRTA